MRVTEQGRISIWMVTLLMGFAAGIGVGLYLGGTDAPQPQDPPLNLSKAPDSIERAAPVTESRSISPFLQLEAHIITLVSERRYAGAIDGLLELDLLATTDAEINQVSSLLEETVRLRVVQLESRQAAGDVDALYERLTLSMPERAEYYLMLAEHRIKMGAPTLALPVLSQIENHHQLGGRARELIAALTAGRDPVLAAVPLKKRRGQYLVRVTIDGQTDAHLMLDTGASMTVLAPALLTALNYRLDDREASFSTAGGVVQAPIVEIQSIDVGGTRIENLKVGALNLRGPGAGTGTDRVQGLLGMDFLSRFDFSLDQDADVLYLIAARDG